MTLEVDGSLWTIVTVVLMVLVSVPLTLLLRILRRDHPETYRELGSPRWFKAGGAGSIPKFARFLFSAGPEKTADLRVRRLCRIIQPLYVASVAWVLWPFVVVIWALLFWQK